MAAPRKAWGALNWPLNLNNLVSHWKRAIPHRSGRAAKSLSLRNTRGSMKTQLVVTLAGPAYLRILDEGGWVPARRARNAKVMKFMGRDGAVHYRRRVRGFRYPARNWVRKGFRAFWAAGKFAGKMPVDVGWGA
ncbi:MAG TPA: hypothetical protein VM223_27185 [Planctomycetota bacterium]|nr:hypothetical protein [Planctomycetota bacterium]